MNPTDQEELEMLRKEVERLRAERDAAQKDATAQRSQSEELVSARLQLLSSTLA